MFGVLLKIYKRYGLLFQGKLFYAFILFYKYQRVMGKVDALKMVLKNILKIKVYSDKSKVKAIKKLLDNVDIDYVGGRYYYHIDEYKCLKVKGKVIGNVPIDYDRFLDRGLSQYTDVDDETRALIDAIIAYIDRIIMYLDKKMVSDGIKDKDVKDIKNIIDSLNNFKNDKARDLDDAIQRILIINMLQHQTNHILVGLGRLSVTLYDQLKDIDIDDKKVKDSIKDFLCILHKHYVYKSNALMGDTGQIIILGGDISDKNIDKNVCKKIDDIIMDALIEEKLSDPKPLIRINSDTRYDVYESIIKYLDAGIGSPLIANDDVIIPCLVKDGYDKDDAMDYVTSACWEPLAHHSYEQNNIISIDMTRTFDYISKNVDKVYTYDDFIDMYHKGLSLEIDRCIDFVDNIKMEEDPLYDFAMKSKYHNYGLLSVGMGNAVNSILNIKKLVYEDKRYDYKTIDKMRLEDYKNNPDVLCDIKNMKKHYGSDDEECIRLVNDIIEYMYQYTKDYKNGRGGHIKYGLSSPHYLMNSKGTSATFDGKSKDEPFLIHISNNGDYTGLSRFASKIHYDKRFYNGNVVDIVVSRDILDDKDKFISYIKTSIEMGIFELQISVLSSKELYDAMHDPDNHKNLVVRVWGFNAYYVELSKDYQQYIYDRAIKNEKGNV